MSEQKKPRFDDLTLAIWPLLKAGYGRERIMVMVPEDLNPSESRVRDRSIRLKRYLDLDPEELPEELSSIPIPPPAPLPQEKQKRLPPTFEEEVEAAAKVLEEAPLRKIVKEAAMVQALAKQVEGFVHGFVEALPPFDWRPPVWPKPSGRPRTILHLRSDAQIGTLTTPEETAGIGGYNFEIFLERQERLEKGLLSVLEREASRAPISGIYIANLGDMVEGHAIYPGQAYHLELHVLKQALQGAEALAASDLRVARALSEVCDKPVYEFCIGGNHGRGDKKKGAAPYGVSWDLVLYHFMQQRLMNQKRIPFDIPEGPWAVRTVGDQRFLFTHGDVIRSWMNIPFYGIDRYDHRLHRTLAHYGIPPHRYMAIGDKHVPGFVYNWFCNGAYPGGTDFSISHLGQAARPAQMVLIVEEGVGVVSHEIIWLEDLRGDLYSTNTAAG